MKLRALYVELGKRIPPKIRERLESLPVHPFNLMHRMEVRRAIRSGPPFRPSHKKIIIDITTLCNLHCIDCNRSCGQGQAPHIHINGRYARQLPWTQNWSLAQTYSHQKPPS